MYTVIYAYYNVPMQWQCQWSLTFYSQIIKFALPIWVLLAALDPIEATPVTHDDDDSESIQLRSSPLIHFILPLPRCINS